MAEDVNSLAAVLGARLDVRDDVIRQGERLKQTATREEVNAGDFRVLKDVSDMMDRTTQAQNQYVRDRVKESALETKNAMQEMEGRLAGAIAALGSSIAALAVPAPPPPQPPQQPQQQPLTVVNRLHPAGIGVGAFSGASVLYLILAFLNIVPRP